MPFFRKCRGRTGKGHHYQTVGGLNNAEIRRVQASSLTTA
nr:MAG TPA: hypothetical protein [Caudoviricetes sp.]